ncbi:unnamed protein product [Microthlaspi erraticum]|uniref:PGG domain-containing protein n=1 Tax=Microthlaspi erraticum TaxID=1685480 RepID=A0A6D2K5M9_9BRAS|nr:unnamed protein product [Microthlaspi erraticum]
MDISEAGLDRIEAQRSTDVSHDQRRKKSFCMNLINKGARTLSSRGLFNPKAQSHRRSRSHAALKLRSTEVFDVILKECPSLEDERDKEGRTCLSFGASMGYYEGVRKLLDRSTKSVYVSDDDGSYPIHMAVEKGHKKIVLEILKRCPYSKHLLNKRGQNILHIAANSGRFQILNHLTTHEQTKHLANEQDVDGNTPLHLAIIKWRPRAARCLVGQENLFIQNNSGLTALDIAELNIKPNYIFRERLTIVVLVHGHFENDAKCIHTMKLTRPSVPLERGGNKDFINALIVVAALVATVTFSAGFTTPGGFKSTSSPNLGVAVLANDNRLHVFLGCDTVAMGSSVIAVVSLIWAQLGDPALFRSSVNLALPLLCFSLLWMANAYFSAMMITVGPVPGFMIVFMLAYLFFLYVMLVIFVPHIFLQLSIFGPASPLVSAVFLSFLKLVNDGNDESDKTSSTQSHMSIKKEDSVEISGEMPHTT